MSSRPFAFRSLTDISCTGPVSATGGCSSRVVTTGKERLSPRLGGCPRLAPTADDDVGGPLPACQLPISVHERASAVQTTTVFRLRAAVVLVAGFQAAPAGHFFFSQRARRQADTRRESILE